MLGEDRAATSLADLVFLYAAQGWGWPELVDLSLDPLKATIRIYDNFECSYTKSATPNSNYLRGHLVGLGSGISGKKVNCVEKKCIAKGDAYCELIASE